MLTFHSRIAEFRLTFNDVKHRCPFDCALRQRVADDRRRLFHYIISHFSIGNQDSSIRNQDSSK